MDHDMSVGQRIRYWRKRRGIKVAVLANQVDRSTSWLEKVERGDLTVDKVSVLLALANVLKISVGDLIGGISLPPNGGAPHDPPKGIQAIRKALFAIPAADREPPDGAELCQRAARAKDLSANSRYEAVSLLLPDLIMSARIAVAHDMPDAWRCLSGVYQASYSVACSVNELDVALISAERAIAAAQRCGDDLLIASSQGKMSRALGRQGWLDEAGALCSDASDAIAPERESPVSRWAVWGSLRLRLAVMCIRKGDTPGAWRALRDAWTAAPAVGAGRNDYGGAFGPANIGAHEVAVALESGDPVEALRHAADVDVATLPYAQRRATFCIDVAHAHSLRRNDSDVVERLLEAETYAPEEVRYSVKARELIRVCLKRERKTLTPGLRPLAERLKITV